MKKLVVLLTALFVGMTAFAQSHSTVVRGVVLDSLTRVGEPAAVIEFYKSSEPDKAIAFTTTHSETNMKTPILLGNLSASADYQHLWADVPGRSFTLSYQFNATPGVNNTLNTYGGVSVPGFDLTDRKSDGTTGSSDHTVQADFTTPLGQAFILSTGVKYINRHNNSNQTDYLWDGAVSGRSRLSAYWPPCFWKEWLSCWP